MILDFDKHYEVDMNIKCDSCENILYTTNFTNGNAPWTNNIEYSCGECRVIITVENTKLKLVGCEKTLLVYHWHRIDGSTVEIIGEDGDHIATKLIMNGLKFPCNISNVLGFISKYDVLA